MLIGKSHFHKACYCNLFASDVGNIYLCVKMFNN